MPETQVPTTRTSTTRIMRTPEFERGFEEARKGEAFDWRINDWNYERGRLFAHIAPLNLPLRIDGKLNPKAVALCDAAFNRRLIV
jgi:hypothetical protein